jgi:hypothetical protein
MTSFTIWISICLVLVGFLFLIIIGVILLSGAARSCISFWFQEREASLKRVSGIDDEVLKTYN